MFYDGGSVNGVVVIISLLIMKIGDDCIYKTVIGFTFG